MQCPLCQSGDTPLFHQQERTFLRCVQCSLIFVDPRQRLLRDEEKARYDQHNNDIHDERYRAFLSRIATPLLRQLPDNAHCLDFGCGPGPALAVMLHEHGHHVSLYDPFYFPDDTVWHDSFDAITATEVFEHLHHPAQEMNRLKRALAPNGVLAIMTQVPPAMPDFAAWYYQRDPTHVAFYALATFEYISTRWLLRAEFIADGVIFLHQQ